ncbi:hypothetical protein [Alkalimarinus coralli]|uniref:hypothetical protein n=1 Tax=Alkalimarinus coralli TaxID=2935863 RepID=UPI00202B6660|nr:hypothetical protein [Alkalimarinus coralli]
MKKLIILLSIVAASGCSFFTPQINDPVIEDKLGPSFWTKRENIGTLSLTPERRVVLVNFFNQRFCAEAPSETGLDLSNIINATGSADASAQGNIALGLLIGSSSGNSVLNKRSQAVQMFLANSYYTCQMYMNGAISGEQMVEFQIKTMNQIIPVLMAELPLLYGSNEPLQTSKVQPLDVNQAIKDIFNSTLKTTEQEQAEKPKQQIRKEILR